MLVAYHLDADRLSRMPPEEDLAGAIWIDLYRPTPPEAAAVEALGIAVPSLEDMEEIEISNRLYRDGNTEVMTVVLPGQSVEGHSCNGPVAFLVTPERFVSVRHHAPRPFETFPGRADQSCAGNSSHLHVFLGLAEEIVARLADIMEGAGRALDSASRHLFAPQTAKGRRGQELSEALQALGREGEVLARVRLGLLTMERALSAFGLILPAQAEGRALRQIAEARIRDIQALSVHADFLAGRIEHGTDVTLGMINLEQNVTMRIVSVVAALFLPPTLVASAYGMNFAWMPGLNSPAGYPVILGVMAGSALLTYLYFKWKGWM